MLFNSLHFLIFLPVITIFYFSIPHKYRWILLLIGSYYFYMSWKVEYILLIIISTLIDYFAAIQIYKSKAQSIKKIFLLLSLFANLGILFSFKYFNFINESVRQLLNAFAIQFDSIILTVLLPVGISFYTFQTLSYTIDVYRGELKPQKHLGIFALYVSFFPQLVAGPIERAKSLLPQLTEKQYFDYKRVTDGLKLILWGFFKKIVIADRLAIVVDAVYSTPGDYSGTAFIIGTLFFAFQIYCDFSGYSDIAIGVAQIFGIKLTDNFKRPYFSRTVNEFWKRWHISLSSWFKDYLYIPLGGNRVSVPRWYLNILVVFLVSGLWHGADWTFVIWGGLHGFYLVMGRITKPLVVKVVNFFKLNKFPKLLHALGVIYTFILVNIGWVFFRANNLNDAFYIIKNIFTDISFNIPALNLGLDWINFIYCIGLIGFMEFIHIIQEHGSMRKFLDDKPIILRWTIYLILIYSILLLGVFGRNEFIYFQF